MNTKKSIRVTKKSLKEGIVELKEAIKEAGTQTEFAASINTHQSQVSRWLRGELVMPHKAIEIENMYGIDRTLLRPDLFGR